jgi:hypothetical protein
MELRGEIARFLAAKKARELAGRQLAAVQIACHVDMSKVLDADPIERSRVILRLERLLERERLRGARRHWSYDLNRHIALKQALDRLRSTDGMPARTAQENVDKKSGARRRRLKLENFSGCPKPGHPQEISASSSSCGPAPSSWQAESGRRRSSALPSDNSDRDSTSRDTARASARSGSSGAA